ncbi:MAG: hypothetical protein JNL10_13355 [Verrucomicrobiales bacterium]|nr:hypothetical protein [Verrucomicrobiales bacterium]
MSFTHRLRILACILPVLMGVGCKDRSAEEYANKPFTLPGASKVLESLSKGDYENTVSGLMALKGSLSEKDMAEYARLRSKVVDNLMTNENESARDAYRAIGMMERGR